MDMTTTNRLSAKDARALLDDALGALKQSRTWVEYGSICGMTDHDKHLAARHLTNVERVLMRARNHGLLRVKGRAS